MKLRSHWVVFTTILLGTVAITAPPRPKEATNVRLQAAGECKAGQACSLVLSWVRPKNYNPVTDQGDVVWTQLTPSASVLRQGDVAGTADTLTIVSPVSGDALTGSARLCYRRQGIPLKACNTAVPWTIKGTVPQPLPTPTVAFTGAVRKGGDTLWIKFRVASDSADSVKVKITATSIVKPDLNWRWAGAERSDSFRVLLNNYVMPTGRKFEGQLLPSAVYKDSTVTGTAASWWWIEPEPVDTATNVQLSQIVIRPSLATVAATVAGQAVTDSNRIQFCAFGVLADGNRVKLKNSWNIPACDTAYKAWLAEGQA